MFNFGSKTTNNANLFGQSTPVNQNRRESIFSFGNATAIPPSTPSSSSILFGKRQDRMFIFSTPPFTPILAGTTSVLQPLSPESTTFPKYQPTSGLLKDDTQKQLSDNVQSSENKRFSLSSTFTVTSKSTTSTSFLFDNNPVTTSAMKFTFGDSQSSKPSASSDAPTSFTTTDAPFHFLSSKPVITKTTTSTTPVLFSTMKASTTSAVDLKLFQTMINTQPYNKELDFLARNLESGVHRDRARRLRTESESTTTLSFRPKNNPFLSILTKPSVLSTNPAPTHNSLSSKPTKRKFADSFIDGDDGDEYEKHLLLTNPSLSSTTKTSTLNIKRPRLLDMNKIRSIVLGTNDSINDTTISENQPTWKQYSNYDEYISSKKPSYCLPKLTLKDYYTKPTIEELRSYFNEQGQCFVEKFTVGRKHYGSVTFQGSHMNLAGLDLDRLVEIDRRQVTVYPDENDRPGEGEGLNCQAVISLLGVYPIDRSKSNSGEEVTDPERLIEMNYGQYLEGMTKKFHGLFIGYDVETGTWTFQVEHF
ncbi:unnamed protein product [Adineta ricciae]|uniref:Peptidase S59 domain-containing protein n=1 Tax=Adineta ricciae TaxID=249248 RepID=A0A816FEE5_ADIRI|nr:unnamed protein product [Adineta ricciae]